MTPPPLVVVTWDDAQSSATRIYAEDRDHAPTVMETVGWLMKQDARGVSICCERFIEDGAFCYRGHTFVPSGIVTSVEPCR